ncbi:MAG: hypothetical protein K0U61_10610 [Alphaproteobacteria bacterium]|nr:hypothetical protein [Alphaproteobacteria bacterium]
MKIDNKWAWARMSVVFVGAGLSLSQTSMGSVVDRPHFNVDGVAIVWAADASGTAPIVSDFIIDSGGADTDLINGDVHTVITGSLAATDNAFPDGTGATLRIQNSPGGGNQNTRQGDRFTSAADVLNPFRLNGATDVRTIRSDILTSFYVATNKAFNIDVVAAPVSDPADLNLIRVRMRMTQSGTDDGLAFGSAAQIPHSSNTNSSGVQWNGYRRLSTLTAGRDIFRGNRRTASSPGTIADQSVRFDLDYRWNTGNIDLSDGTFDVEADVIYTVYIP